MNVQALVNQVQSSDHDVRTHAEDQIRANGSNNAALTLNALFTFIETASISDGQTAVLLIKNLVVTYWAPGFAQFTGPTWPDVTKQRVRELLISLVAHPTTKGPVRDAAESIVARIATIDYPDQWPDLIEITVGMIMNDQTLPAGLTLFKELLGDTVGEEDFWKHGEALMAKFYDVISSSSDSTQLYALQCFHECMNFFLMGENEGQLSALEKMAGDQLHQWNLLFASLIKINTSNDFLHELFDTLNDLQSGFTAIMVKDMPLLLEATFEALKHYGDKEKATHQDVIALQIDFLEVALNNSPSVLEHLRQDPDSLSQFISMCIDHACIIPDLQELWTEDFNEFITHEQELSIDVWPRPSVGLLIGAIKTPNTLTCLLQYLQQSNQWVKQESCLFLISCVLELLPIESQQFSSSDVSGILVFLSTATGGHELLLTRAIITAGRVCKYMHKYLDPEARLGLVIRPADMLINEKSDLIRCALLKTATLGCALYPKQFKPYQNSLLQTINAIIPAAEDDTPTFLVDCFLEVLRLDFDAAISYDEVFSMFFALVAKGTANLELNAEILNLVGEFMDSTSDSPQSQRLVFNQLLSPVLRIFSESFENNFEFSSDLQFALDICGVVFERCNPEVMAHDKSDLVKLFENLILSCSDPQILQAGAFGYAALMERTNLNELSHDEIQRALEITSKLLDPGLEDSAALAAGRLVTALLENFTDLGQILGQVFVVAAQRMIQAKHAYLVESLSLAFAGLFIKDTVAGINLLASNDILAPFLKAWLSTFEVVRGADELLKYVEAMQALFDAHDERVEHILIDDEVIHRPEGIPVTRSKGLKFSQIPIPLKIVKLLIRALDETPVPLANTADDDDDDWTDEVVYSLEGNPADARAFAVIMDWFKRVWQQNMEWYQRLNDQERAILLQSSKAFQVN